MPATRAAFQRALARQSTGGASFSATADGAEIVTLSGGTVRPGTEWGPDTRTTVMSVAKGLSGLARFCERQPSSPDVVIMSALGPVTRRVLARAFSPDRSLGFALNPAKPGGRRLLGPGLHSVGAGGYGGQVVLADPDRRVSVAFVRSALMWSQKEISALVDAFYRDLEGPA